MKQTITISFIGAGNMGSSLIGGLITAGFAAQHIWASNPDTQALQRLQTQFNIHTTTDNQQAAAAADVIVLCVKPKDVAQLCQQLQTTLKNPSTLLISIAAGIPTTSIAQWLNCDMPVVRCMPNTPALVQAAMTGLYATQAVNTQQREWAEEIMRSVGAILWVEKEDTLDKINALSGSGPAYFLLFMEALRDAGTKLGLTREEAHFLTLQTAFGAAKLALESNEEWATLRKNITSPGGTTEQAIHAFTPELFNLCDKAVIAAFNRAKELASTKE